jgi:putative ABC transport system permease protein
MLKVMSDFVPSALQVYLNKDVNTNAFIAEMEKTYIDEIIASVDIEKAMEQGMSSYASIVILIGQVMLAVAGFVIVLVLYFVISSSVIRRRRELGIQKAMGYTTINLMNQISIGFLFPLILGIAAGCVLGAFASNPLIALQMSMMGIMKTNFIADPVWITATGVGMAVLSYAASMFITWRIRKISAYALVTE